jgi:hypothetical protein
MFAVYLPEDALSCELGPLTHASQLSLAPSVERDVRLCFQQRTAVAFSCLCRLGHTSRSSCMATWAGLSPSKQARAAAASLSASSTGFKVLDSV